MLEAVPFGDKLIPGPAISSFIVPDEVVQAKAAKATNAEDIESLLSIIILPSHKISGPVYIKQFASVISEQGSGCGHIGVSVIQ
jgi:hypothetical protein